MTEKKQAESSDIWGINTSSVVQGVVATRKKRVLLHFPAGLANKAVEIVDGLHKADKEVKAFVWSEPCFGACDVPYFAARELECDLIVTFGHSPMRSEMKTADGKILTIFIEPVWHGKTPAFDKEKLEAEVSGYKRVGLVSTVQYLNVMKDVKNALEKHGGHSTVVADGGGMMSPHAGQVTGCDFAAAEEALKRVDCMILVSDGSFHTTGLARIMEKKPLLVLDPTSGTITRADESGEGNKPLIRAATFLHSKKVFGILVSIKPGQKMLKVAERLESLLEARGKTAIILAADSINPGAVANFSKIEVLVNASCPRLVEDEECFEKPLVQAHDMINACLLK